MSVAVTMTARQLKLEEYIQCHGLIDGGHAMVEYYDPVLIFLYIINNILKNIHKQNEVIRNTIAQVISSESSCYFAH